MKLAKTYFSPAFHYFKNNIKNTFWKRLFEKNTQDGFNWKL